MPEENCDYLDIDNPINGQSYCCLSFISHNNPVKCLCVYPCDFHFTKSLLLLNS